MAVAQYLKDLKIEGDRLKVNGKGESNPVAINANSDEQIIRKDEIQSRVQLCLKMKVGDYSGTH